MQALSRRDREAFRHRQEILSAAAQIFAEKGFHNATMEDIAQASEFAIGSLYKHFRSKEAIYLALFQEKLVRYLDGLEDVISQDKPFPEMLDDFLLFFGQFGDEHQAFFRLFHKSRETADWHKEDMRECIAPQMERYVSLIRQLASKGVREGHLRNLDLGDLTAFILGTLQGFFFATVRAGEQVSIERKFPLIRSLLLNGAGTHPAAPTT
jgi:AcrR family transcriptional regulator